MSVPRLLIQRLNALKRRPVPADFSREEQVEIQILLPRCIADLRRLMAECAEAGRIGQARNYAGLLGVMEDHLEDFVGQPAPPLVPLAPVVK